MGVRRASRGVKNQVWASAAIDEAVLATGGQLETNIVQEDDWSGTGGERGTVMTIRGWMSISADNDAQAKAEGTVMWYIGVVSANVAAGSAPGPASPGTYVEPTILTTGGFLFGNIAAGIHRDSRLWEINVKTKRTVTTAQQIRFVLFNGLVDTINVSAVFRALVRKGGN